MVAATCLHGVAAHAGELRVSRPVTGTAIAGPFPTVAESWADSARRPRTEIAQGPIPMGHLPNFATLKAIANARRDALESQTHQQPLRLPTIAPALVDPPQFGEFDGPDEAQTGLIPPDTILAAGPDNIVVLVNSLIAIYDKLGNQIGDFQPLDSFFGGMGIMGTFFDVRVIYDLNDSVFIITSDEQRTAKPPNSHVFIAVSQTSDPTGMWNKFAVSTMGTQVGGSAPTFADFPTLGMSSSAIYTSTGQFVNGSSIFSDTWLTVVGLPELLAGNPDLNVTQFMNVMTAGGHQALAIEPALLYGPDPGTEFLAAADQNSNPSTTLNLFAVNTSGTPTLTAADLTVPSFSQPPDAVQEGTTKKIESNDTRLLNSVWQNNSLFAAQNVADPSGGNVVSRWYEVGLPSLANATLNESGTVAGAGDAYYPAITQQPDGTVVMGYTTSSTSAFASAAFSGRASADSLGAMRELVLDRGGTGIYVDHANRWGDYSGASVDPSGTSSWVISECADAPNPSFCTAITQVDALGDIALSNGVLDFGDQDLGVVSVPLTLFLTNESANPVTLSPVTLGGTNANQFKVTSDGCSNNTLGAGTICGVTLTFTPASLGAKQANLSFSDSTGFSAQTVNVGGIGVGPNAKRVPTKLTFAPQTVGTSSAPQTITVTSTGGANLIISQIMIAGDYSETDDCVGTFAPGQSCTIEVTFTPTQTGKRLGLVTIDDNAGAGTLKVNLTGTGD